MPTIGVFAAIFDQQGRILLVRRNYGPKNWTTPGGRLETGESPLRTLKREVQEETGFQIEVKRLIDAYSAPFKDDLVLFFEVEVLEPREWRSGDLRDEVLRSIRIAAAAFTNAGPVAGRL